MRPVRATFGTVSASAADCSSVTHTVISTFGRYAVLYSEPR